MSEAITKAAMARISASRFSDRFGFSSSTMINVSFVSDTYPSAHATDSSDKSGSTSGVLEPRQGFGVSTSPISLPAGSTKAVKTRMWVAPKRGPSVRGITARPPAASTRERVSSM